MGLTPSAARAQPQDRLLRKLAQAVNLGELRKQKLQVEEYVTQLEKQLPGKAEMDALLSDINQAGIGARPAVRAVPPGAVVKDYYAELPIAIKVRAATTTWAPFAADIANLSRIVTLYNLDRARRTGDTGAAGHGGHARTYRYLDLAEVGRASAAEGGRRPNRAGNRK